ncbi:DUF6301 family protein [Nocardia xishanensis]
MQVDIDKVVEKISVASRFDWTWTDADLSGLCAAQGWQIAERDDMGGVFTTDFKLMRPRASWYSKGGQINQLIVFIIDRPETSSVEDLRELYDGFAETSCAIGELLGPPTLQKAGADGEMRWDLPNVVIRLSLLKNSTYLEFMNPEYQVWLDASDDEEC